MEFINKITASSVFSSSKCFTCAHGVVLTGRGKEVSYCGIMNRNLNIVVESCSDYRDKTLPSIHDMEDIAFILKTDEKTRKIGFSRLNKDTTTSNPFSGEIKNDDKAGT